MSKLRNSPLFEKSISFTELFRSLKQVEWGKFNSRSLPLKFTNYRFVRLICHPFQRAATLPFVTLCLGQDGLLFHSFENGLKSSCHQVLIHIKVSYKMWRYVHSLKFQTGSLETIRTKISFVSAILFYISAKKNKKKTKTTTTTTTTKKGLP